MLKNRALQLKMVKTTDSDTTANPDLKIVIPQETADTIVRVHKEITKNTVLGTAAVIAATAVAYTLSQIAIDKATN